jgi:hypothetical protein
LFNKRIVPFVHGICLGIGLHLSASLVYQPNPLKAIQTHLQQLSSYGTYVSLDNPVVANISVAKGLDTLLKLTHVFRSTELVKIVQANPTALGLTIFCVASLLIWKDHAFLSKSEQLTILLPLTVMLPGTTFLPYLAFTLVVVPIQFLPTGISVGSSGDSRQLSRLDKYVDASLIFAISLSLCPLILPNSSGDGRQLSTISLIPLVWIFYVASCLVRSGLRKKLSRSEFA